MEENQMTPEEIINSIARTNANLREAGMDSEQIARFWTKIFKEHSPTLNS